MEESGLEANSSPPTTVEEIQRRLLRPPLLHSQSSIPFSFIFSSRDNNLRKQGKSSSLSPIKMKTKKKKKTTLEDYLNPVILSTVRAKLSGGMKKRKVVGEELKRLEEEHDDEFKWPIDELKMFKEDSNGRKWRNEEVVNLGDDSDLIGDDGDDEVCCTLGKFEVMALKKFKGGG